jgi:hypothetical protein
VAAQARPPSPEEALAPSGYAGLSTIEDPCERLCVALHRLAHANAAKHWGDERCTELVLAHVPELVDSPREEPDAGLLARLKVRSEWAHRRRWDSDRIARWFARTAVERNVPTNGMAAWATYRSLLGRERRRDGPPEPAWVLRQPADPLGPHNPNAAWAAGNGRAPGPSSVLVAVFPDGRWLYGMDQWSRYGHVRSHMLRDLAEPDLLMMHGLLGLQP